MTPPVLRPLSLGEVLDVSFGLYRSKFAPLLVIAAVSQVVPAVLNVYINAAGGLTANLPLYFTALGISLILGALGVAASTYVVSDAYLGRETSAGVALSRAAAMLGRLIVISLLSSLLITIGLVLLIIPGLVLLGGLMLATVVAVLESPSSATAAMGRSWALSKGYRGKVLLTVVVAFLMLLVPTAVIGGIWGLVGNAAAQESIGMMVVQSLLSIFIYPFVYVVMTVLYYDIRVRKEGFDLELLASSMAPA